MVVGWSGDVGKMPEEWIGHGRGDRKWMKSVNLVLGYCSNFLLYGRFKWSSATNFEVMEARVLKRRWPESQSLRWPEERGWGILQVDGGVVLFCCQVSVWVGETRLRFRMGGGSLMVASWRSDGQRLVCWLGSGRRWLRPPCMCTVKRLYQVEICLGVAVFDSRFSRVSWVFARSSSSVYSK
jgi:hypothetical protein